MKSVGQGVYERDGAYYVRPGNRTWRRLDADNLRSAREEAPSKRKLIPKRELTVAELVLSYQSAGCPKPNLTPRGIEYTRDPLSRAVEFFGERKPSSLKIADCVAYREHRRSSSRNGDAGRASEIELAALSSALNWAVSSALIDSNPIRSGRPKFSTVKQHCRDRAFKSCEELHEVARKLLSHPRSAVLGWQMLVEAFTGLRTNEALALRLDAQRGEPGWIENNCLWVSRSKRGMNPFVFIHEDLRRLIEAHRAWINPESRWWFPSSDLTNPVGRLALTKALSRMCGKTSHGLRSFYVTTRRSQGIGDAQIAVEIGDRTVSLISQTYGDAPPNWFNGNPMRWVPENGKAAWES